MVAEFSEQVCKLDCRQREREGERDVPRSHQMGDGKESAKENAKATNDHIGDSHKGILAANDRASGYQNRLLAIVLENREG